MSRTTVVADELQAEGVLRPEASPGDCWVVAGRYQLLDCIGAGGMGVVWRSFDLELEEVVAIKFLREDLANDDRRLTSFRREAKLARQVTHPNVARVFEYGRDQELYFLTMEFIPGESLQARLAREGALAPHKAVRCAVGLCRGLAAAHAAGIVHGDIKPANILLAPRRGAVLTDFGIARALYDAPGHGELCGGTPIYMAPEQMLGATLARQSDIYVAGVVLFETLTGVIPWSGVDVADLLAAKCGPEPDLRVIAPELPEEWRDLIGRCLRSNPAERPADGRALLTLLREAGRVARLPNVDGRRWTTRSGLAADTPADARLVESVAYTTGHFSGPERSHDVSGARRAAARRSVRPPEHGAELTRYPMNERARREPRTVSAFGAIYGVIGCPPKTGDDHVQRAFRGVC